MSALLRALRSPGAMREIAGTAPTQYRDDSGVKGNSSGDGNVTHYIVKKKPGILDRGLDWLVRASGSVVAFIFIQTLLVTWAFLGIPFSNQALWPIIISDVQAIFSYVFDSFLMRQQLNGYYESLDVAAELKSRSLSTERMLKGLKKSVEEEDLPKVAALMGKRETVGLRLPEETRITKAISFSSMVLGHILFVILYWACIFLWLSFGHARGWSNEWQLDINSSTSALMVFIFSFLAILRERHGDYIRACLNAIYTLDAQLEHQLRDLTHDDLPNDIAIIPAAKTNPIQRAINYYADIVGTLVGIGILIVVLIAWIAVGPALQFSANWWLFIGTYAGLIGMNDGFVLRNVQSKLRTHEETQYAEINASDIELFWTLDLPLPDHSRPAPSKSLSYRMSEAMNGVCGHEITVLLGVLLIIGLLTGSSIMRWSETGQLLCNVPPSIIESFFMIILITGHNAADEQKRRDMGRVLERRKRLLEWVGAVKVWMKENVGGEKREGEKSSVVEVEEDVHEVEME